MNVGQLKNLVVDIPDEREVVFAEYQGGETALWYLNHCVNVERQAEFGQVWFSRGMFATDLMTHNDKIFQAEQKTARPLVNPHASALQQDKQLRAQQRWDKKHSSPTEGQKGAVTIEAKS